MRQYIEIYKILEPLLPKVRRDRLIQPYGSERLQCDKETHDKIKELEKSFQEEETKEEKAKRPEPDDTTYKAVGSGDGRQLSTPVPNVTEYNQRLQRLLPIINELLRRLKLTMKPILRQEEFRRSGRLMSEIIGKVYTSSLTKEVDNIYDGYTRQYEKEHVAIAILVDISGSMSINQSKDMSIILMEVLGRWLRDQDFMILMYESDYYRIKTFTESYHNTRYRLAGLLRTGGTVLYEPLLETYRILKHLKDNRKKIVMIVSDFYVERQEDCLSLIDSMRKDNISIIGIGLCRTSLSLVRQFTKGYSCNIHRLEELPSKIVDIYMDIVRGKRL